MHHKYCKEVEKEEEEVEKKRKQKKRKQKIRGINSIKFWIEVDRFEGRKNGRKNLIVSV